MSSQPFHGVAYERLPCEDIAIEGSLHGNIIFEDVVSDQFPNRQHVERRLLRKLDLRMSILVLIYTINHIDRSNVAAARLRGFEDDLHLEGQQFNTVLSIFYVGYALVQVPSNMFLNEIGRPSIYIPMCVAICGFLSVLMGATKGFMGAVCTNFFLGLAEAVFYPGALFLLSKWYKRRELGQRTAILSCGLMFGCAFGSLLASAILGGMDQVMGQAAWRWLFYIEGSLTVFVAVFAMFIVPDFPATSSGWLTAEEHALARFRIEEDVVRSNEEEMEDLEGGQSGLKLALADWKVWWLALELVIMDIFLSFGAFSPTLSATLGYSPTVSLLLCAPPWLFAAGATYFMSRHSDQAGERFGHIAVSLLVGITGFLMAMATMNKAIRYLSLFLITQSFAAMIIFFTWVSNSITNSSSKRAVALAFINALSSLGRIAGSYAWPKSWGPSYRGSFAICIGAGVICIMMSWIFRRHLMKLNQEIEAKTGSGQCGGPTYLL